MKNFRATSVDGIGVCMGRGSISGQWALLVSLPALVCLAVCLPDSQKGGTARERERETGRQLHALPNTNNAPDIPVSFPQGHPREKLANKQKKQRETTKKEKAEKGGGHFTFARGIASAAVSGVTGKTASPVVSVSDLTLNSRLRIYQLYVQR